MRCDEFRELIVLQLSGELEKERESELSQHLEECADCRQTQAEFRGIVGLMRQLPEREWDEKLRIKQMLRRDQRWRAIVFSKAAIWVIGLAMTLTAISMLPLRWEVSAHGVSLQWGKQASQEMELAGELKKVRQQLTALQRQNQDIQTASEIRFKQLIDQNNVDQQKRYWQTMELFSGYVQLQRKADLQKLQQEIAASYDRTGQEVEKTNELIEYVMRASSTDHETGNR